ncbi:MAG: MCE family protein [Actinomycetota bacterium]|nr:MCE family protein [Actinomycetota bacterium]
MRARSRVLATAISALLLAGISSLTFSPRSENNTYRVTAYFEKTIGLFVRSDVRVLGVAVGKVVSVEPQGTSVRVVMQIASNVGVPKRATATIVPISLISDRYIQLSPPYKGGPRLISGDVIGTSRTSIPVELDDLLASLKKFLDAVEAGNKTDPGALGSAINNLNDALKGTGGDLSKTLGGAGTIGGVVADKAIHLDGVVVHLTHVLEALSARGSDIATLSTHLARSVGAIAQEQSSLEGTLSNLASLTTELGKLVRDHRSDLESDLSTVSNTTQAALRHQDSLIMANDWLPVLGNGGEYESGRPSHSADGVSHPRDSQNTGPTHLDVRDVHYGMCPSVCALLPLFRGTSTGAASPATRSPFTSAVPKPSATPTDLLGPSPQPSVTVTTPPLLRIIAAGDGPIAEPVAHIRREALTNSAESWFVRIGAAIAHLLGRVR